MSFKVRLLQHRHGFLCEADAPGIPPVIDADPHAALGRLVAANPHRFGIALQREHNNVADLPGRPGGADSDLVEAAAAYHARGEC